MRVYGWLAVFCILGMAMCANAKVPDFCEGYTEATFTQHCAVAEQG